MLSYTILHTRTLNTCTGTRRHSCRHSEPLGNGTHADVTCWPVFMPELTTSDHLRCCVPINIIDPPPSNPHVDPLRVAESHRVKGIKSLSECPLTSGG